MCQSCPEKVIRTRYAPSPTGFMHVGNLRTALYEYLVAKSQGGRFLLRIEDTDQNRQVDGALDIIYDTLKQVGLRHDEGPDVGGDFGPYIQSERLGAYRPAAEKLVEMGQAYYCFCTEERLAGLKENSSFAGYDRHCRHLTSEEIQQKLAGGCPYVIRQKMPLEGETCFDDAVYGRICVKNEELEDQILLKSDGFPTYNFANVVDDHDMNITHVVRGSEYLSSTPKYNLLYDAFGYEKPTYVHLPLILGEDGQKLSKRHGATGFHDLLKEGYLPEAIINYIALLGWAPKDNQELFSLKELEEAFDVAGISKSPSIFDYKKLKWFNQEYFKRMSLEDFTALCRPALIEALGSDASGQSCYGGQWNFGLLASILQPRLERLVDLTDLVDFLVHYQEDYDLELFAHKKMKTSVESAKEQLPSIIDLLEGVEEAQWTQETLHDRLLGLAQQKEVKNGQILWPCRIALTGKGVTPGGAIEVLALLSKKESLRRLKHSLDRLQKV